MVDGVVFDPQVVVAQHLAELLGAHQRREAGGGADQAGLGDREDLVVAPQVGAARGDRLTRDRRRDGGLVEDDLHGAEALHADVVRLGGGGGTTVPAFEGVDAHIGAGW